MEDDIDEEIEYEVDERVVSVKDAIYDRLKKYGWILALIGGYIGNEGTVSPISTDNLSEETTSYVADSAVEISSSLKYPDVGAQGEKDFPDEEIFVSETAIERVFNDYRSGIKDIFNETSFLIKSGTLKDEISSNGHIQTKSKELRIRSFRLLNNDVERNIGGDKWSPEKAAKYWFEQGESL